MSKSTSTLKQKVLRGMLWTAHQALRARGFKWEVQRQGESKLGLWRKKFRKNTLRKPIPTRFVFIPGFGDTPLSWLGVLTLLEPVLRRQFDEIVLVDFPGHNGALIGEGLSPSFDALFDSLFDVLDSLKPHTVTGHSLGGFFATHYAVACSTGKRPTGKPQKYRGLDSSVVMDPSGFLESEEERKEWEGKMTRLVQEGASYWRPFVFAKEPFWFKYFGEHFMGFLGREEVGPFLRSMKPEYELSTLLPEIKSRLTLVWGEKDALFPAELAQGWLKHMTQTREPAHAVLIRDAGHSPHIEAPAATAAVLGQILSNRKPHAIGNRWYKLLS
jgi:pimeloyl-ACP methyl ester carboxylesterase